MALIVRVGVLTPVSWLNSQSSPQTITVTNNPQFTIGSFIPLLSPVTIPQVVAVNENVFSVNLPGKITDK
jgi:hypothetical protein